MKKAEFAGIKKHIATAVAALSITAFSSLPVLAEENYTCKLEGEHLEYTNGKKSRGVEIKDEVLRKLNVGNVVAHYCSEDYTLIIFERGIYSGPGGDYVLKNGTLFYPKSGYINLDKDPILSRTVKKAEIKWGSVAVLIMSNGSVIVLKNLDGKAKNLQSVLEAKSLSDRVNYENCGIEISGDPVDTLITIKWKDDKGIPRIIKRSIIGTSKEEGVKVKDIEIR